MQIHEMYELYGNVPCSNELKLCQTASVCITHLNAYKATLSKVFYSSRFPVYMYEQISAPAAHAITYLNKCANTKICNAALMPVGGMPLSVEGAAK